MNISLFLARRLQLKGTKRDTSSSSTVIAVVGVAIAIIVMVLTITVVLGFKHQIREKVMGFDAQVTINPQFNYHTGEAEHTLSITPELESLIDSILNDQGCSASVALSIKQPGIMKTDNNFAGLMFKGVNDKSDVSFIKKNLIAGEFPTYDSDSCKNKIVISSITANSLCINLGDKINTYFFCNDQIRTRKFEIAGIYNSNFGEYDKLVAFASMPTLQRIAMVDSVSGTSIEISQLDFEDIDPCANAIQSAINQSVYTQQLSHLYRVNTVFNSGAIYFNWLDLLDTNVVVILILMGCVAGITLVSCLFIIILERVKTIGLLKAIGATNRQIRLVFVYMALRLVLRGLLIGNAISLTAVILQDKFQIIPLDPEAYYLSFVPVEINWLHILLLNIGVILVSFLLLLGPSHLVSKISPSQTMRYE